MTTAQYDKASAPGTYDHRGGWCHACNAQGPFYRAYKSSDVFRCCACDVPQDTPRDATPLDGSPVTTDDKDREIAALRQQLQAELRDGERWRADRARMHALLVDIRRQINAVIGDIP